MTTFQKISILSLVIIGLFVLLRSMPARDNVIIEKGLNLGGINLDIELAQNAQKQVQGLSGRPVLPPNRAMLFAYNKPGYPAFWMKDMNFAIDIIWLDKNWMVADITENVSPETFPKTFTSASPVQYVLEVNGGFAKQNIIHMGDYAKPSPKLLPQFK